ncbi:hypothetical protein [Bacillus wiedmannii]|nr:hypothetical protein [Bacillus wiedmannii]
MKEHSIDKILLEIGWTYQGGSTVEEENELVRVCDEIGALKK